MEDIHSDDIHSDDMKPNNQACDEDPHYYSQVRGEAMIARSSKQATQATNPVTDSKDAHLQEATGRVTRETQGSKEENMQNGPVEDKDDDGYLSPVNTGQASKVDDPSQASKLDDPGQGPKSADCTSPEPAPQAAGVYDYAYAHFRAEGWMRDPTAKKPERKPGYTGLFSKKPEKEPGYTGLFSKKPEKEPGYTGLFSKKPEKEPGYTGLFGK